MSKIKQNTVTSSLFIGDSEPKIPAICIRDVNFAYQDELILENVNLDIYDREFVSVIGPNGSGKTTLIKLILGLLHPQKGSISILGEEPQKNRDKIGYVPQHAVIDFSFPISVLEVVLMGLVCKRSWGWFSKDEKEKAAHALATVGLVNLSHQPFRNLSGGQRQRVLIARALVGNPRILLFDEPTAHVDVMAEQQLTELLKQISTNITVVLVSHDLGFVSQYVDTVVCVNRKVQKHPTNAVTGSIIQELYGSKIEMVYHGFSHPEETHTHE